MRRIIGCLICLVLGGAVGCSSNSSRTNVVSREQAEALGKAVRAAMTEPSLLKLDKGQSAGAGGAATGLRGLRQREAALPILLKLIECGEAAEEPLWDLMNDADEDVRLASVMLVGRTRVTGDLKPIDSRIFVELSIPLLERALTSRDSQVRYFACSGLGDFAIWSDVCLERLKHSLPKIRELQNDDDQEVRRLGWIACNNILATLSVRATQQGDREMATRELEQLQLEKYW